jgi:hypothetical protein
VLEEVGCVPVRKGRTKGRYYQQGHAGIVTLRHGYERRDFRYDNDRSVSRNVTSFLQTV